MWRTLLALALLAAVPRPAAPSEKPLPDYRVPASLESSDAPSPLVTRNVGILVAEQGGEAEDAWRILAGIGRPATAAAIRALPKAGWFGRSLIVHSLAESGVPEVEPVLTAATEDPSWAVREAAVIGLSRIESESAPRALLRLGEDPSWRVRRALAIALRRQVSRGVCPREDAAATLLALARDEDRDVRFAALRELGNLRSEEARDLFLRGFLEGDEREREVCLAALTRLEAAREDLLAALAEAMTSTDDEIFLPAAEKYAELAGEKLLEEPGRTRRLLSYLRDGSGSLVPVTKIFEKVGRPAAPLLLEELRNYYRSPRRLSPARDPSQPILDLVEKLLGRDAAPVLKDILLHWEEALPTRRYAVVLVRRYHAKELSETLADLFPTEGFADLRAALLEAIEAAAHPDLARFIEAAIRDGNSHVRSTAQEVLKRHPEIDLREAIEEAVGREKTYAQLANEWLGLLAARDREATFRAARDLLRNPDPEFRARGAVWLRLGTDKEQVLSLLTSAFREEEGRNREEDFDLPEERLAAARARVIEGILKSARAAAGEEALPLLAAAATDADPVVREKALAELAKIPGRPALDVAIHALVIEKDPLPQKEARRAVARSAAPEAQEIVEAALDGPDPAAREGFLKALLTLPDAPIPAAIPRALSEGAWTAEARALAVSVLRTRKDSTHLDLFVDLVTGSRDHEVRVEAIQALGELRDPRGTAALLSLLPPAESDLRNLDPGPRQLAALAVEALGDIEARDAVPRLLALLEAEWPLALTDSTEDRRHFDAAVHVLSSLGRIGDDRALEPLVRLLFTPGVYRGFALVERSRATHGRNLLGTLVGALIRYPDPRLVAAGDLVIGELLRSGDAYRLDEGYLEYLASTFEDPRRDRIARNRPRRGFAAALDRVVLKTVPRESSADESALAALASRAAAESRWEDATQRTREANRLAKVIDPVGWTENCAYRLAKEDFFDGLALFANGEEEKGLAAFGRGLARDPEDPDVLNLYAWWLTVSRRHLPRALDAALEAGRRSASSPYILDTIGWTLHRLGRHEEAAWRLLDAVRLDLEQVERTGDPTVRLPDPLLPYHLAAAASMAGRLPAAAERLQQAVAMDDTLAEAARASADFEPLRAAGMLEPALEEIFSRLP